MRDKNESIYFFILEEQRKKNRERALEEKRLRQKVMPSKDLAILDETDRKENTLRDRIIPYAPNNREFRAKPTRHDVEVRSSELCPLETKAFELEQKDRNLATGLGLPAVIAACSLISIVALLQLDAVVNQDLYSHGLQFSLEWATPYWIAIRTELAMLWLMMITAILLQIRALRSRGRYEDAEEKWKTYVLGDGTTIKVKTMMEDNGGP